MASKWLVLFEYDNDIHEVIDEIQHVKIVATSSTYSYRLRALRLFTARLKSCMLEPVITSNTSEKHENNLIAISICENPIAKQRLTVLFV